MMKLTVKQRQQLADEHIKNTLDFAKYIESKGLDKVESDRFKCIAEAFSILRPNDDGSVPDIDVKYHDARYIRSLADTH